MTQDHIKTVYLHSALRALGYTYTRAMAAPAIRACLIARARAQQRTATGPAQGFLL